MVVIASSCFLLGITNASAQKVLRKSENMRPVWLVSKTPETTNETFHYQLVEAENESLEKARHDCLLALSRYIEQAWKISGEAETDIRMEQKNGAYKESSVYNFHYKIENEEINVTTTKYDEYWEYVYYPGGGRYHCYVLFGVADVPAPRFDRLSFTRKYGVRGMARSLIVPGWGQMYKGSTAKGLCILGGEVLLAGGIIASESLRSSYVKKMRRRVLDPLTEKYGVDTSDAAIRQAVKEHNEVCSIISEIGELRKEENPVITGYEFHVLNLVSFTCPKYLILPYLRETLTELKKRKPDPKPAFRARVAIVGSEIDDPQLTKLIEGCGALVVSDRYCFGSTPGREIIELRDGEEALPQICMHIMQHSECARYIADEKVQQRRETADRLAREYHADGIIYEQMKYCDYWGFERALVSHIMHEEYDWPVLSIDRLYNNGNSGQLRTRVQAFVESLEIKKLHKQNGGAN